MKRTVGLALVLAAAAPAAWAQGEDDEEEASDEEDSDDEEESGEEEEEVDDGLPDKQNLTGRDEGTSKTVTEFERDRFFVDKVDNEKSEDGTLVQGSLASSTFFYGETGGAYPGDVAGDNSGPKRLFTELRLQTDFRHIAGSRWEARVDARGRLVLNPTDVTFVDGAGGTQMTEPNKIQSGLFGTNEYDLRELWLIRSGKRSDVFIGRQFVPDLGGFKFDGMRVDYAKSAKLTLIGFGGLLPVRGSRSITTDYLPLKNEGGADAGRFVGTAGFGGAYRTINAYGAIGGAAQFPLQKEQPRIYVTSNGYLRNGAKLDFYHYVLIDILGAAAQKSDTRIQLTNLSAGVNFKPNPRLRLTAAAHRVDTETLNVQAGAFLNTPDADGLVGPTLIQNEVFIQRIATNQVRGGVSAGLGKQQRFEISMSAAYRLRPEFTLRSPGNPNMMIQPTLATLPKASSVEVWGSIVDRRSYKNTRIGIDVSRSFAVGDLAFQRSVALIGRGYALREIEGGRGEWEAEVSYSDVRNTALGTGLGCAMIADCYGTSQNKLYSIGGQLFYRLRKDWFGIGTLHLLRITNKRSDGLEDPGVIGATMFARIAKRF